MHLLKLTVLWCTLAFFSADQPLQSTTTVEKATGKTANQIRPGISNIIFQSKDGGATWQDISSSLPQGELPESFFSGGSEIYLRVRNELYHSKSNLETPVWEKEKDLDPRCTSIAFNPSGVMAIIYPGKMYRKLSTTGRWTPIYTDVRKESMRTIFETSDGAVFLGCDDGLFKSKDGGKSWKHVIKDGWVMDLIESDGVMIATSQNGIVRSTDMGEHWERVISEGGVGIAVERISGGFAAIAASKSTVSRRIHISLNNGKTWRAMDDGLRPSLFISSIKQVGPYLLCGHPDGVFRSSDLGRTSHRQRIQIRWSNMEHHSIR